MKNYVQDEALNLVGYFTSYNEYDYTITYCMVRMY